MSPLVAWLSAFAVTQAVEVPVYVRALKGHSRRWWWAFGASAVTHPVVFFGFGRLWPGGYWSGVAAAEAFAVAVEAAWLSALGVERSVAWALLANGLSVAVGLGLRAAIGWP